MRAGRSESSGRAQGQTLLLMCWFSPTPVAKLRDAYPTVDVVCILFFFPDLIKTSDESENQNYQSVVVCSWGIDCKVPRRAHAFPSVLSRFIPQCRSPWEPLHLCVNAVRGGFQELAFFNLPSCYEIVCSKACFPTFPLITWEW